MLAGQLADAVATPLSGIGSDRSKGFCGLGRRGGYFLIGTFLVVINFFFVFGMCLPCKLGYEDNTVGLVIYYSIGASIFNVGWAIVQVAHMALVPDLTHDEHERVSLNSARYAFTIASNVLVFILLWFFINGLDLGTEAQFEYLAYSTLGVGILTTIFFLVFTREPPLPEHRVHKDGTAAVSKRPGIQWRQWFRVPAFYQVGWVYMCARLIVNVTQSYLSFYVLDVLKMDEVYITVVPLLVYLSSFISTALMKKANKRFGRKRVFFVGTVFCAVAVAFFWILTPGTAQMVYIPAFFFGLGSATVMVCSVQLEADLVDKDTESSAFVYGALSLTDKFSNGIAIFVLQLLNDESATFMRWAVCGVPSVAAITSLIMTMQMDIDGLKDAAQNALQARDEKAQPLRDPAAEESDAA